MGKVYHVSKRGCDSNDGMQETPFLTIQKAATVMGAGDKVVVHEGEYREWVKPECGGLSDGCRITYEAAEGERVVIKGSERITGWKPYQGTVWYAEISNELFGDYNPYDKKIEGDWLISPHHYSVHAGDVYVNGKAFYEAASLEEVLAPKKRFVSEHETWGNREEAILEPDRTIYQWISVVNEKVTVIYANFHEVNPNVECTEINVRKACFFPEVTGINYITVKGFEMMHAATYWAPPTAMQIGLLGPNWSKGWIIENNMIHDSKCSGISLGKEVSTGDNDFTKWGRKPGYQYQMEAVFKAGRMGWSKETVGSHIVRRNVIYDCGQTGIVGHMGCAFSEIYENEIYNIGVKHEFYGHELGGIKFHAAIDTMIHHNYIHHCSLGTWLDWQVQGTRVSSNIYDSNNRDLMVEVTHGPYIVDHNIFTAEFALVNAAQGGAYIHNLCGGFMSHYTVMRRSTPYHYPHSTEVLGCAIVYGSDDRWYQNIFVGGDENEGYGTADYNGATISMDEYIGKVRSLGYGDVEQFEQVKQPAYINGNLYLAGAKGFEREEQAVYHAMNPGMKIVTVNDEVYLDIELPKEAFELKGTIIDTDVLGMARIPEQRFENPDGSEIVFGHDMLGAERGSTPTVGPLEHLKSGKNHILLWRRR